MTQQITRVALFGLGVCALIYAVYNIRWQDASVMTDGCACGREREYIVVGRTQYNLVIKNQGNPKHQT